MDGNDQLSDDYQAQREAEKAQWKADVAEMEAFFAKMEAEEAHFMATRGQVGTVGVESFRGKLRLRMPRLLFAGKQKYVYTRYQDDNEGWHSAYEFPLVIERDIAKGKFDFTLNKYKLTKNNRLGLKEVWVCGSRTY